MILCGVGSVYWLRASSRSIAFSAAIKACLVTGSAVIRYFCDSVDVKCPFAKRFIYYMAPSACLGLLSIPLFVFRSYVGILLSVVFAALMSLDKFEELYDEKSCGYKYISIKALAIFVYTLCIILSNIIGSCLFSNIAIALDACFVLGHILKHFFVDMSKDLSVENHDNAKDEIVELRNKLLSDKENLKNKFNDFKTKAWRDLDRYALKVSNYKLILECYNIDIEKSIENSRRDMDSLMLRVEEKYNQVVNSIEELV